MQDLQNFFWEEGEVNAKLEKVMKRAFREVHETFQGGSGALNILRHSVFGITVRPRSNQCLDSV